MLKLKKRIAKILCRKQRNKPVQFETKYSDIDDVKGFMHKWNTQFPIDRWWREKHKVPFNSTVHRDVSFIDMVFEFEEDKLLNEIRVKSMIDYKVNSGKYYDQKKTKKIEELSYFEKQQELQALKDEFDSMDKSQYEE